MAKGYVYFITYENAICRQQNPFLKIGIAKDVSYRLSQLQIGSPIKLTLAGFIEVDDPRSLEQYLLKQFSKERVSGEWVKVTSVIINFIRIYKLKLDRFDELFCTVPVDEKDLKIQALTGEVLRLRNREDELKSRLDAIGTEKRLGKEVKQNPLGPHHGKRVDQYRKWSQECLEVTHRGRS